MSAPAPAPAHLLSSRSACERVSASLHALEGLRSLNCVTTILAERALRRAELIDAAQAKGQDSGPLAGMPFAAKNIFDVEGLPTLAGARAGPGRRPAPRDAEAIRRLEAAGAILVATTAMDEFAYGYTNENDHHGAARNPRDPARTPGGSSGGSAAVVAAGAVPLALGTDTNGSIRVPAALSGCFGLKPTFGSVSRRGVFPFVASLDHVGPLARSATDLAMAYDALRDPAPARGGPPPQLLADRCGLAGLRIGVARGYFGAPLDADARGAVEAAAALLGARETVELPEAGRARAAGFLITNAEAGNLHRSRLAADPFAVGPLIRDRLFAGALLPAHWYLQAQRFRRWFAGAMAPILSRYDLIVLPATPCIAPPVGAESLRVEDSELPARLALGLFVQPLTILGTPIAVAPRRGASGMPVGVQLMARAGREDLVLDAVLHLEQNGFSDGLGLGGEQGDA